ncbi:MAG: hypothetical protein ACK4WH_12405, partial [Phycisphaerales bacterium]
NWVWMARRHGHGLSRVAGALLGCVWAHRLAGWSLRRQRATLKGAWEGLFTAAPPIDDAARSEAGWRELLRLLTDR